MLDWDHQLDLIREHSQDATGAVNAHKVSIISLEDGEILTKPNQEHTFEITQEEAKTIAQVFKDKNFDEFKQNGINIENTNFRYLNAEGKTVFARKQYYGSLTIQATLKTVIIAFTQEAYQQTNTNLAVRYIAEYFEREEQKEE